MGKNPYLQHGWGKKPEQKAKEKEYNHQYYEKHKKDKWGVGLKNAVKNFGDSVNDTLKKHNDNWQSGMDMILNKNVTQKQRTGTTKKKVNPYNAYGMAANERAKAEASQKQYRQATAAQRRAEAMAKSESAKDKASYQQYMQSTAAQRRADAMAESEKARRANAGPSDVVRRSKEAKADAQMRSDLSEKAWANYGRRVADEDRQQRLKNEQQDAYRSAYKNEKDTKEKRANESYAQENAANRNRAAKIKSDIEKLENEYEVTKYLYDAHGNPYETTSTKESYHATAKKDQERRNRMSEIKQELDSLYKQYDAIAGKHNTMVDTANTYNANRDLSKEKYEAASKEYANVTKKINQYNDKLMKLQIERDEAKRWAEDIKNGYMLGNYTADAKANAQMHNEDQVRKLEKQMDQLLEAKKNLEAYRKEISDSMK